MPGPAHFARRSPSPTPQQRRQQQIQQQQQQQHQHMMLMRAHYMQQQQQLVSSGDSSIQSTSFNLSPSTSFNSMHSGQFLPFPPLPPSSLTDSFPIIDWLALGNHLFTLASIGFFLMNFFSSLVGKQTNGSLNSGMIACVGLSLGFMYIASSTAYWIDILLFPAQWGRRKFYHPLKRQEEEKKKREEAEEEEEYILEHSHAAAVLPLTDADGVNPSGSEGMHTFGVTLPHAKSSATLYEEDLSFDAASRRSTRGALYTSAVPPFAAQRRRTESMLKEVQTNGGVRKVDPEDEEEESEWNSEARRRRGLCACCSRSLCPHRMCPIRTETWSEIFNMCGAILNSVSSTLPYALLTFRPDTGIGLDSVPLSLAIMDFSSMSVWLLSSLLVFHVWRRDKTEAAREEWEGEQERHSGIPRRLRQRAEEMELIAESLAKKQGRKLPPSAAARFNPAAVPRRWIDPTNLQWWAVVTNVGGSVVYWAACIYGITVSLAVAEGKIANLAHSNSHSSHSTPADTNYAWLTPKTVQGWIANERLLNLCGDCIYLASAIFCELVYYIESNRESKELSKLASSSQIALQQRQSLYPSPSSSDPHPLSSSSSFVASSVGGVSPLLSPSSSHPNFSLGSLVGGDATNFSFGAPTTLTQHLQQQKKKQAQQQQKKNEANKKEGEANYITNADYETEEDELSSDTLSPAATFALPAAVRQQQVPQQPLQPLSRFPPLPMQPAASSAFGPSSLLAASASSSSATSAFSPLSASVASPPSFHRSLSAQQLAMSGSQANSISLLGSHGADVGSSDAHRCLSPFEDIYEARIN